MEVSIFCPRTQAFLGFWVLAERETLTGVCVCEVRAAALETVANVSAWEYVRKARADQSWKAPDVRNS